MSYNVKPALSSTMTGWLSLLNAGRNAGVQRANHTIGQLAQIEARSQMRVALRNVVRLREILEDIKDIRLSSLGQSSPASVRSGSDLFLRPATDTTLQSVEEINATPTSFSPFGPDWSGSTAQVTLSGQYDGSGGTGTLTLLVDRAGTHGEDDLKIDVIDTDGSDLQTITIKKDDALDEEYTLDNGLILNLGDGDLLKTDTLTVAVDASEPTSFSPITPTWVGSSAIVTMDGVYDGSDGTGTLTFEVAAEGTHSVDDLKIDVKNANGDKLESIDIKKEDALDKAYTLDNGMVLTLGAGDLLKDTTFTVDVSASVGSSVDPNKSFDGTRNDNPSLEYGLDVTTGSFRLNGVEIDVAASDTLNEVLSRINQADTGVTVVFDPFSERLLFTQETAGAASDIVLGSDTSGFLAATKLAGATSVLGVDDDADRPLAQVPQFASVTSGTITINEVEFSIDVNTDSLTSLMARINNSAAGATITLDTASNRVSIVSTSDENDLILASGATSFFEALDVAVGTHVSESGARDGGRTSSGKQRKVINALKIASQQINSLFSSRAGGTRAVASLQSRLRGAMVSAFETDGPEYDTKLGINFNFRSGEKGVFDFSSFRQHQLARSLSSSKGTHAFRDLMFGDESADQQGIVDPMLAVLNVAEKDLVTQLGGTGVFIDTWA